MKKIWAVLTSILIGILLIALLLVGCKEEKDDFPVGIFEPQAMIEKEFTVCYEETGDLDADKAYLIIDLSDSTYYPHEDTSAIQLVGWRFQGTVSSTHEWHAQLGVVVENDATDGSVEFIATEILADITGMFEASDYWEARPLDLWVESSSLLYVTTNMLDTSQTTWQNDTVISSTYGTSALVAPGDLVLWMDEIASGSTIDFSICIEYDTR